MTLIPKLYAGFFMPINDLDVVFETFIRRSDTIAMIRPPVSRIGIRHGLHSMSIANDHIRLRKTGEGPGVAFLNAKDDAGQLRSTIQGDTVILGVERDLGADNE